MHSSRRRPRARLVRPPPKRPQPPTPTAMSTPAMSGPLVANSEPVHLDIAPFFGPMYVGGRGERPAGLHQTDPTPSAIGPDFNTI